MNRQQILSNFYLSPEVDACIHKQDPPHLRDDLKSELFAVLCELDEPFLIGLHQRKELKFYAVRIILNMIQSNTSPFYKKFRGYTIDINSIERHHKSGEDTLTSWNNRAHEKQSCKNVSAIISNDEDIEAFEQLFESRLNEVEAILNSFHWYTAELFRCYVKHGSIRKVSEEVGIPSTSVFNTIKKVRAKILELCSQ